MSFRLALMVGVVLLARLATESVVMLFRLSCLAERVILVSVRRANWKEQSH